MMWSKERAEKARRYSSKWFILAARLFLFSKGSRSEIIAAVKRRNWTFVELAHLDKLNPVVRCKWIKKNSREVETEGALLPPLPPNPRLLLRQAVLANCLGEVVPGHVVFCGSWCSPSCGKSPGSVNIYWCFPHWTALGWLGLVLRYAAKRLISKSPLQKQHRHPPSPLDTFVSKLMLIVSFWSSVAYLTSTDQLLENPLAAWH